MPNPDGPAPRPRFLSVTAWCHSARQDVGSALKVDLPLLVLLLACAGLWGPLVGRSTDNPQHLAAFINDEPMIAQQLVGMTLPPFGNPANLLVHPERRPAYWGSIRYDEALYYGGTYLDAGFFLFAPLKLLGLPDFPAAPVALRCVSLLSALVGLVLVYNLGNKLGGRAAGFGAALLLLVDFWFNYYASIIHPDSSMMALGLLALWVAIRHVENGRVESLVTFGLLVGLVHGAKAGGFWLMPLGLLAVVWAGQRSGLSLRRGQRLWLWQRLGLLLGTSLAGFALSTPYAFLDSHYFKTLGRTFLWNRRSPFAGVSYAAWFGELWNYEGYVLGGLAALALLLVPLRCWRRDRPIALTLTAVLLVSLLAWYTTTVRLWVVVGYLLPGLALACVLAAELATRPLLLLRGRGLARRWSAAMLVCCGCLAVLYFKIDVPLHQVLLQYCRERWTVVEIGRWAEENLPHDSKIIYDDVAYFDPAVFPNARFHGGLLTYDVLEKERPDYFVLSASIYQAPYYLNLMHSQTYSRGHEGPFSVLLYQDALERHGVPGAERVHKFHDHTPTQDSPLGYTYVWGRLALGLDRYSMGTELRLYRYRPPAEAPSPQPVVRPVSLQAELPQNPPEEPHE